MAFVDPNVLLANAAVPCLDKCLPPGIQWSILISLAARWGGLSTDPAVLLAGAPCFDKCISPGMQRAVLVSLAAQIAGNTGPPIMPPAPVYGPDLVPDFASYNDPFEGPFCSYTITGLTVGLTYYIVPDPQTAGNIPLPNYTQPTQFVASDTTLELIGPCGMNVAATLQLVTFP